MPVAVVSFVCRCTDTVCRCTRRSLGVLPRLPGPAVPVAGLLLVTPAAWWWHAAVQLAPGLLSMWLWPCCERCRAVTCAPGRLCKPCCRCYVGRGFVHTAAGLLRVSAAGWSAAYTSWASPACWPPLPRPLAKDRAVAAGALMHASPVPISSPLCRVASAGQEGWAQASHSAVSVAHAGGPASGTRSALRPTCPRSAHVVPQPRPKHVRGCCLPPARRPGTAQHTRAHTHTHRAATGQGGGGIKFA